MKFLVALVRSQRMLSVYFHYSFTLLFIVIRESIPCYHWTLAGNRPLLFLPLLLVEG